MPSALHAGLDVAARRLIAFAPASAGASSRSARSATCSDPRPGKPLQEQLASANALVSFYAAAALVQIDAQRAMPGIMNQLAERESWPGEAMARLLVDAGADVAREPIRALMLSLAPAKVPPLLPWLSHVDAVLGSEVAIELLRRHPDDADIVAAALVVVHGPGVARRTRALCGFGRCGRAQEPRQCLRPARRPRRDRDARAAHVRQASGGCVTAPARHC